MEIYESYLEEAISEECMQSALDFLYLIPEKMKDDFSKFGFPQNEKQEYMWEYVESAKSNGEYQYFWKPDSYCRVLLACQEGKTMKEIKLDLDSAFLHDIQLIDT